MTRITHWALGLTLGLCACAESSDAPINSSIGNSAAGNAATNNSAAGDTATGNGSNGAGGTAGAGPTAGTSGIAGDSDIGLGGTGGIGGTGGASAIDWDAIAPECRPPDDWIDLELTDPNGVLIEPEPVGFGSGTETHLFEGIVTMSEGNSVRIASCPGWDGVATVGDAGAGSDAGVAAGDVCNGPAWKLDVLQAPNLVLPFHAGMRVKVEFVLTSFFGIGTSVLVTDLSEPTPLPVLAVSAGVPVMNAPFAVAEVDLGCFPAANSICNFGMKAYALDFSAGASSVHVNMSETKPIALAGAAEARWDVRNVRAFSQGSCDEYYTTNYYVVLSR